MTEKNEQETHRHAWPPEAITCYMPTYFVLKEQEAGCDTYTLVRVANGKAGFMIRTDKYADLLETVIQDATIPVFSVTPRQLIEGSFGEPRWKYGSGDAEHKYDFAKHPDYFLKPDFEEREEYEPKPKEPKAEDVGHEVESTRTPAPDTVFKDYCHIHKRKKHKDGHALAGKGRPPRQKYQCPACKAGKPPVTTASAAGEQQPDPNRTTPTRTHDAKGKLSECYLDYCVKHDRLKAINSMNTRGRTYRCSICVRENKGRPRGGRRAKRGNSLSDARKAALAFKLENNPRCLTCGEHLRKGKTHKRKDGTTAQYWKCINHCTRTGFESDLKRNRLPDTFEELLPIVEKKIAAMNGHDRQNRLDIVQNVALLLWQKAWTLDDLEDKKRLRAIIKATQHQYADKFAPKGGASKSLDAPVRESEPDSATRIAFQPAPDAESNPHQQLEAKEAVAARLRGQPAAPPNESIVPVIKDAHDSDGGEK